MYIYKHTDTSMIVSTLTGRDSAKGPPNSYPYFPPPPVPSTCLRIWRRGREAVRPVDGI